MARTFKQYGCAHDTGGSLTAVVEIGGVEVYNGSVTADTEPHGDLPEHVELFNFDLAEDVSGDTAWSVTVTGTDDASTMHLGALTCNKVTPTTTIPLSYFTDAIEAMADPLTDAMTADQQTYVANTLGETALGTTVYNKLVAGTSVPATDARVVMEANETGTDTTTYHTVGKVLTNGATDGEAYDGDMTILGYAPMIANGETWTMTAALTIPVYAYDPPLPE
jgi:hypothetical protein